MLPDSPLKKEKRMNCLTIKGRLIAGVAITMAIAAFASQPSHSDAPALPAANTYVVADGAFPWYDRINSWALTNVPATLKGADPVAQESCSSRSLEIAGSPKSILIGVSTSDVDTFKTKVPDAKPTGDTLGVKNVTGTVINYAVFSLANPPAKIDGAGIYNAGLILLKASPSK
jgi:hypothetical protein